MAKRARRLLARSFVKVRILISLAQVLNGIGTIFDIPYPPIYSELMSWFAAIELDLFTLMPMECVVPINFHTMLFVRTLWPIASVCGLWFAGKALLRTREWQWVGSTCHSAMFFIAFLVYPGCSAKIFQTFQCYQFDGKIEPDDFTFDDGSEYGADADIMLRNTTWLRADLSIDCQSDTHTFFWGYAVLMVFVYPIGTPILYYVLLRRHKPRLDKLHVNQALRIQLLEEVRAKRDYACSHVSADTRQVPWLISKAERARLPSARVACCWTSAELETTRSMQSDRPPSPTSKA